MIKLRYLVLGLVLSFLGCAKSGNVIPSVSVNFEAPLTDPRYSALNVPGNAVLVNGYGVAGLILYRRTDGGYAAYDRCSTYNPQNKCAVTLDAGNFTVTDPCSGSKFLLLDGSPAKGPATQSLKSYYVTITSYEIFVTN
jgi:nitrite reductase/ring-hydroxylating ferredoxin subunit